MKNKIAAYSLSLFLFAILNANATYVPLRSEVQSEQPQVKILHLDAEYIQFEILLPGVHLAEGTLNGRSWDRVEIIRGGFNHELGCPETPNFNRLLTIPSTSGVRAEFEALESTTLENIHLMPSQGMDPTDFDKGSHPVRYDINVYSKDAFYPEERVIVGEPAIMRGLRLIPVQMNPVRYNPVTNELQIIHRFIVTIHYEGLDHRNIPERPLRPVSRAWFQMMKGVVLDLDELDLEIIPKGSYLIVCENDNNLVNTILPPLVDWKRRKGHSVTVQTFSPGASNSTILNMIQTAYNTWEVPPEYVLLYGDTSGEYTLPGWQSYGLDHPYSQLEGNDILADVAVGRLPAENSSEAVVMRNKVLYYEEYPYTTNTNWYHQGCLVAGSGLSGISTIQTNRWIKTRMIWNEYTRIDTFWYTMGSGSVNSAITTAINDGVTYCNYRGWLGMENFEISSIDNLNNGRKLPFCTILTCGTGGFAGDSFMEHFVSVGSSTTPKGAVACVGLATTGTHTRYNNTLDIGMYAGIFDENVPITGHSLNRGKLELYNAYQTHDPSSVTNFSNWAALAGDPGMELFTGAIKFMTCEVPATVTWGENILNLTVNETGIGPLDSATVCLYKAGEFQEVGVSDGSGQITLPMDAMTPGFVMVTVTGHNFYPIVDSLEIIQSAVAVGYFNHIVDDDETGGSSGDGDGVINPGETVEVPLIFKNYGLSTTATNISVSATESDEFATLIDSSETFPNIAPGGTGNSVDDFDISIEPDCPNGHTVRLDLVTSSDQGSWNGLLDLEVVSYEMTLLSAQATGGDTLLSPGETADLVLTIRNNGGKNAVSLQATVVSLDPFVTVNDNAASFGNVAVGSTASCNGNPFNLTVSASAIPGHPADLEITYVNSWGSIQRDTITIILGIKSSTDPQGPDEYGYCCFDNTDVYYPQAPVYNWIEIDPAYGGNGSQLNLNDPSSEQDASINVHLPFTFRYYGTEVNVITVCTNGWISTVANTSFTDFRNYPIPSSVGPNGMIAPFWDDLITWSGGHVFTYEDATNHRFVIEWSRMKNLGSPQPQETFEIVLFDPVYYPTSTGDGEILFQYNTIQEVSGSSSDNPYSTVGIESPDQQDGIEIVYWNTYTDPAVAHLQNGRAYFFTTNTGDGGDPPIIGVSPPSLTLQVPQGGTSSEELTISNTGGSYLIFSTSLTYGDGFPGGLDASGGPDAYGYTWIDSDEPGGPDFNWVDITGIGTPITWTHNDSTTAEMPIGFDIPFYGQTFSQYIVSANGWISFSSHSGTWNNSSLPNSGAPFDLVAGFWDDLDPLQAGAEVRQWSNNADSLVVSFLEVPHYGSTTTGTYTFQMILTASGAITYQYQTLVGTYNSCTVGIQNSNGTDGLQIAYDQTYLHNGLAIQIEYPILRIVPPSGAVAMNSSLDIEVIANASGLEPGTYEATLGIDSNDPVTPHVDVPITMNVTSGPPPPIEVTMEPQNPPITIPPNGGSFVFNAGLTNLSAATILTDFWIMVNLPNGTPYGPTLLRQDLTLPPGANIFRTLTQQIPAGAPAGNYYYYGIAGIYPDSVTTSDGFNFTKLAGTDGGMSLDDWLIFGWEDQNWEVPEEFSFQGGYPNPFNPVTQIQFNLPNTALVQLKIYDLLGRQVAVLLDRPMNAGYHTVTWDAGNFASGVYFLRFQSGSFTASKKLLLLK